jgi:hypothetical protein
MQHSFQQERKVRSVSIDREGHGNICRSFPPFIHR